MSLLDKILRQGDLEPTVLSDCEPRVRPDWIFVSSTCDTCGCSSGVSRAARYHTIPATQPIRAQAQNEKRQPWCAIVYTTRKGDRPEPAPTPAKIRPLAAPRS